MKVSIHRGWRRYAGITLAIIGLALSMWSGYSDQLAIDSGRVATSGLLGEVGLGIAIVGLALLIERRRSSV